MCDDAHKVCLSRRRFFETTAAMGAGMAGMIRAQEALAAKVSKAEANYRNRPNDSERCFVCKHYFVGHCSLVEGRVSAYGWCRLFKPSASASS